jgi:hypothetical protein
MAAETDDRAHRRNPFAALRDLLRPAARHRRCPACAGAFVYPVAVEGEPGDAERAARLRCGQCGVWQHVVLDGRAAASMLRAVARDLDRMTRMADALAVARTRAAGDSSGATAARGESAAADA